MTEDRKKRIEDALESYTQKMTASPAMAKRALENEGIYQADGELSPQYREPAAANRWLAYTRHLSLGIMGAAPRLRRESSQAMFPWLAAKKNGVGVGVPPVWWTVMGLEILAPQ